MNGIDNTGLLIVGIVVIILSVIEPLFKYLKEKDRK